MLSCRKHDLYSDRVLPSVDYDSMKINHPPELKGQYYGARNIKKYNTSKKDMCF
jgi:hypothetical protein